MICYDEFIISSDSSSKPSENALFPSGILPQIPLISSGVRCIPPKGRTRHKLPSEDDPELLLNPPGAGLRKDRCGKKMSVYRCADFHDESQIVIRDSCDDRACPVCGVNYRIRQSKSSRIKIRNYENCMNQVADLKQDPGCRPGKLYQIIFSPDQEWAIELLRTEEGLRTLQRECNRVVKIAGVTAGIKIFHAWRNTARAKQEFGKAKERNDRWTSKGRAIWLIKNNMIRDEYWYLAPHFHILGYGWLLDSDLFHKKTAVRGRAGWIYKKKINAPLETNAQIERCIMYLLSHAPLIGEDYQKHRSISYLGGLWNQSKELIGREWAVALCPHREKRHSRLRFDGTRKYFQKIEECLKPVLEWVGYSSKLEYNETSEEFQDVPVWDNSAESFPHPLPGRDYFRYSIETWEFFQRDYPDIRSVEIIDNNPFKDKGPPLPVTSEDTHHNYAYDHNSKKWIDENGEVVVQIF